MSWTTCPSGPPDACCWSPPGWWSASGTTSWPDTASPTPASWCSTPWPRARSAQRELAARTYVEEQTIGPVLERLERAGHVSRERDPADRRRVVVTVTEAGSEVYEHLTATDAAESIISVRDLGAFRDDLMRIITTIRPRVTHLRCRVLK